MARTSIMLVILATLVGASALRADDAPQKKAQQKKEKTLDAKEVLARIDGALFFPDRQKGLKGYSCRVSMTKSAVLGNSGKMVPDASSARFVAKVKVDAAKSTRTWSDRDGKPVPVGAWTPFCGPWTLTHVVAMETELFLSPLSSRFPKSDWTRKVERTSDGWRLDLTPKSGSVSGKKGDILKPAVTRIELTVGKDGVPTGATLGLDQRLMREDGQATFHFVDCDGKKRIETIKNTLSSANLTIHPMLKFAFKAHKGFLLPEQIVFEVPPGNLSPTMGRMMGGMGGTPSALLFTKYEVKGRKKR